MTRRNLIVSMAGFSIAAWVLYALLGSSLTRALDARFGTRVLRMAAGKTADSQMFIQMRLREAVLLLTAAILIALAQLLVASWLHRRTSRRWAWILSALSGFVCLNAFAVVATHTVLFWCFLFTGTGTTHNYTQYRIKSGLMREMEAPRQAVLLGSSQTRAEIDEGVLNDHLGARIWTTELHFPGNQIYDMLLNLEDLPSVKVDYIITYLSEGNFFIFPHTEGMMFFLNFRNLPEFYRLGGGPLHFDRAFGYGLLGNVLPLFRLRDPLLGRILGPSLMNLSQDEWNQSLSTDLATRGRTVAAAYHFGTITDFQKKSFGVFADKCRARHAVLIVCCGQLNPFLGRAIDPSLRPDMLAFLRSQAAQDTNIVFLDESQMPVQTEKDYDDLTHVNTNAQVRFSEFMVGVLEKLMQTNAPTLGLLKTPGILGHESAAFRS
jgi:hypothetical protein